MASRIGRRQFLASAAVGLATCARRPARRPNILLVLADDMSWPHAGAYDDKVARTPAFDRVAREGVLFTNSFCASPSCTPSRSGLLTGRPMWQLGEAGVLYGTIPTELKLFPLMLEDAGYWTGFTGKGWGPGNWTAAGLTRCPTGREYNKRLHAGQVRTGIDPRDYVANFEDFLKDRPQGSPFFFWLGAAEPHRIYARGAGRSAGKRLEDVVVPPYLPDTEEIRSDLLDYYMEVEWFDAQLGRALAVLEKSGELDDTLIVVTSDNGLPFPRAKANLYEDGVHMPLAIRWGRRFAAGGRRDDFVSHIDLAPTFLEAAGIPVPDEMVGRSLLNGPTRDRVFTGMERHTMCRPDGATYPMRAMRTGKWLYIRNFASERWPTGGDFISSNKTIHGDVDASPSKDFMLEPKNQKLFAKEYQLCFGKHPAEELFDVSKDPHTVANLAALPEYVSQVKALREELQQHLRQTHDPRIEGRDPWQQYAYRQTTGYGAAFNKALTEEERRKASEAAAHKPE